MQHLFESNGASQAAASTPDPGVITLAAPPVAQPAPAAAPAPPPTAPHAHPPVYLLPHQMQHAALPASPAVSPAAWYPGTSVHAAVAMQLAAPATHAASAIAPDAHTYDVDDEPLFWRLVKHACLAAFAFMAVLVALNGGNDHTMTMSYATSALLLIVTFVAADRLRFAAR